jgi:citrate synthase
MDDEFVTASEACALLGVKPATLYAYVSRGLVTSYQQGKRRQRLYRRSELGALRGLDADSPGEEPNDLPDAASWVGER